MMLNPTQVYADQKTKTALVMVPSSEEELELAKATRNKLHVKMNDSACVEKRVNVTPPNYSKENFMATFTPQTQLTPEQDFEKTCKKRITPTGITEGERGFEQTKRCYLTEVIPFFNLLKEHFEGIQKSLVTEVRAMKAVFENLEAEVDQNETDLRSGEIERKNLLITNENLVAECLSKDVFYTATDSVLNVSRFSDMHDAFTSAQKRIADLESENFNLRNKIQNDDHDSMIKHFSKLEVEHFNLQLKYQNLKERFGNKNPVTSSDAPSFDSLFVIGKLNEQIQSRGNTIRELKEKISRLTKKNSDTNPIFDLKALYTKDFGPRDKQNASTNSLRKKGVTFVEPCETSTHNTRPQVDHQKINSTNVPGIPSTGVKGASAANRSKPRSNTKKDRTLPAKSTLKQVEAHSKMDMSNEKHKSIVFLMVDACELAISQSSATKVWWLKQVKQVWKAIGKLFTTIGHQWRPTGRILPLGDQWPLTRNTPPKVLPTKQWKPTSRLLPLGRQCPLVRFTALKSDCLRADPKETNSLVVQIVLWNRTLVEVARTMLIFSKAPLFLWAEAVATACLVPYCSLVILYVPPPLRFGVAVSTDVDEYFEDSNGVISRCLMSLQFHDGHSNRSIYVKNAFLNGELKEEVYVSQPEGFVDPDRPHHVYRLKKALYRLKQAPRAWYDTLSKFLSAQGFSKGVVDQPLAGHSKNNKLARHLVIQWPEYIAMSRLLCPKSYDAGLYYRIMAFAFNHIPQLFWTIREYQLEDIFTKALPRERFEFILPRLGMKSMKPETLKDFLVEFRISWVRVVEDFYVAICLNILDIMADVNAPVEQAPAVAPPTRTDEQILPRIRWVPIGKSNCYLDAEKSQSNPIYKIMVDILKHTNFFRAFTASSTIPSIYIQQFWDTICYDKTDEGYKCQLDEQWFNLTKDTLRDAL
ncbi:integrase, catalytic region, zinc finger, CCHC-type containing protein [Tanacetum coccineum]|uniref:Integrase, catalytic region, zinc finger, CCHC-type containing protein n=1 Tax=Tanacetum coccineum TaxID=301880 RepID=A0ABQ5IRL8_9ASTR